MGYVIPSGKELRDWFPTLKEFKANPGYYWKKLREDESTPYWCRHFGIPKCISKLFRRG